MAVNAREAPAAAALPVPSAGASAIFVLERAVTPFPSPGVVCKEKVTEPAVIAAAAPETELNIPASTAGNTVLIEGVVTVASEGAVVFVVIFVLGSGEVVEVEVALELAVSVPLAGEVVAVVTGSFVTVGVSVTVVGATAIVVTGSSVPAGAAAVVTVVFPISIDVASVFVPLGGGVVAVVVPAVLVLVLVLVLLVVPVGDEIGVVALCPEDVTPVCVVGAGCDVVGPVAAKAGEMGPMQ